MPAILSAATVGVALAVAAYFAVYSKRALSHVPGQPYPAEFHDVAPGILRKGFLVDGQFDDHVFLVKTGSSSYILVDTGIRGDEYEQELSKALRVALSGGKLELIVV